MFPLNGRTNVISACKKDQRPSARRRLYIVDGDQDLIVGQPRRRLKHLYRLNVYCAENLLMSENALIEIAQEGLANDSWASVALKLDVKGLMERAIAMLLPLHVLYAVVYKLDLPIVTMGYPVQRLLSSANDPTTLSQPLIAARMRRVLREIRSHVDRATYEAAKSSIVRRLRQPRANHANFMSGKTYLLPLLHLRLKQVAGIRDSFNGVKVRLAQQCELDIDPHFPGAVREAIEAGP